MDVQDQERVGLPETDTRSIIKLRPVSIRAAFGGSMEQGRCPYSSLLDRRRFGTVIHIRNEKSASVRRSLRPDSDVMYGRFSIPIGVE